MNPCGRGRLADSRGRPRRVLYASPPTKRQRKCHRPSRHGSRCAGSHDGDTRVSEARGSDYWQGGQDPHRRPACSSSAAILEHVPLLTDRGLQAALESLADRAPFPVEIEGVPPERLDEALEAALYYVAAESLTNAAKHAQASAARIVVSATDQLAALEVYDDGRGGANLSAGSGLRGLADRVEALGGRLDVRSAVAGGTAVRAKLPRR